MEPLHKCGNCLRYDYYDNLYLDEENLIYYHLSDNDCTWLDATGADTITNPVQTL